MRLCVDQSGGLGTVSPATLSATDANEGAEQTHQLVVKRVTV